MKRAFVTGGTGFVGRHVVEALLSQNWHVIALHRRQAKVDHFKGLDVELVQGLITDAGDCERGLPVGVDGVFHVAGDTSFWSRRDKRQFNVNVIGTRNMVAAALKNKAGRFIHTSSIAAFGFHETRIDEAMPSTAMASKINYSRTKRQAELEVLAGVKNGLDAVILNPANIIGPYDYINWSQVIRLVQQRKIPALPPGKGCFAHVSDVAKAHVAAYEKGRTGHNYLLGGVDAGYPDLMRTIGALVGQKVPERVLPAWALMLIGYLSVGAAYLQRKEPDLTPEKVLAACKDNLCSSEKATGELNFETHDLEFMFSDCYRWMVREGLLA